MPKKSNQPAESPHVSGTPPMLNEFPRKWQEIAGIIERDILTGSFSAGEELPELKSLAVQYGICYRTLRKAIALVTSKGRLERYKKGYRVPAITQRASSGRIAVIITRDSDGRPQRFTSRSLDLMRIIENECSRSRVGLDTYVTDTDTGRIFPLNAGADNANPLTRRSNTIGAILIPMGMNKETVLELISQAESFGHPTAVLEETGIPGAFYRRSSRSPVKVFCIADTPTCAETMGKFLLELGHRHVAYISPYHGNIWSPLRLQGLRNVIIPAGGSVHAMVSTEHRSAWSYVDQERESVQHIEQVIGQCAPAPDGKNNLTRHVVRRLQERIRQEVSLVGPVTTMQGMFEQVLMAVPLPTAWIGASDQVGLAAIEFLRGRGRSVPQEISVCAFDDSDEAFSGDLTSYNFNIPTVVHSMLHYILDNRSTDTNFFAHDRIEIEGFINRRGSTAPAGKC